MADPIHQAYLRDGSIVTPWTTGERISLLDVLVVVAIVLGIACLPCIPYIFSEKQRRHGLFAPCFSYLINNEWVHVDDVKDKRMES